MVKNSWSRDWQNLNFSCWNPLSYSVKCHSSFCQGQDIDVQGLTELHNNQNDEKYKSDLFITPENAELNEQGESVDPAAGVAIMSRCRACGGKSTGQAS